MVLYRGINEKQLAASGLFTFHLSIASSCGNCKVIAHRLSTVKDADLIVAQLQTALSKKWGVRYTPK